MTSQRPFLVELEGADGVGKTTAYKYIAEKLRERGYSVLETREVGNPNIETCVKLRQIVLDPNSGMNGQSMELVFSAMRLMNTEFYKTLQGKYDFILNDRGLFSHLAYTDNNVSEEFTEKLYTNFILPLTQAPDLVVYLKAKPEVALARRRARNGFVDAIEAKGEGFQVAVMESFMKHLTTYNQTDLNIELIDANQDIDGVRAQLDRVINTLDGVIQVGKQLDAERGAV